MSLWREVEQRGRTGSVDTDGWAPRRGGPIQQRGEAPAVMMQLQSALRMELTLLGKNQVGLWLPLSLIS